MIRSYYRGTQSTEVSLPPPPLTGMLVHPPSPTLTSFLSVVRSFVRSMCSTKNEMYKRLSTQVGGGFGWGAEGDGVIEMTGTFTRDAIAGVEGIWMRPSTQVVTLRFRRAAAAAAGSGGSPGLTPVEGSVDWPEEQASAEFRGTILAGGSAAGATAASAVAAATAAGAGADAAPSSPAAAAAPAVGVLALEGKIGEIFQGAPERVGWAVGAEIHGMFCKDGTDGRIIGSWSARAAATALEPLKPGGMRLNVGLLPDRMLAAEGNGPGGGGGGRSSTAAAGGGAGSAGDPVMGSSCR